MLSLSERLEWSESDPTVLRDREVSAAGPAVSPTHHLSISPTWGMGSANARPPAASVLCGPMQMAEVAELAGVEAGSIAIKSELNSSL